MSVKIDINDFEPARLTFEEGKLMYDGKARPILVIGKDERDSMLTTGGFGYYSKEKNAHAKVTSMTKASFEGSKREPSKKGGIVEMCAKYKRGSVVERKLHALRDRVKELAASCKKPAEPAKFIIDDYEEPFLKIYVPWYEEAAESGAVALEVGIKAPIVAMPTGETLSPESLLTMSRIAVQVELDVYAGNIGGVNHFKVKPIAYAVGVYPLRAEDSTRVVTW